MTAQVPDYVGYGGVDHELVGVEGVGLFDLSAYGLDLEATSSANWRGYVAHYEIRKNTLCLTELSSVGVRSVMDGTASLSDCPLIEGVAPIRDTLGLAYQNLDLSVGFSGGLLIARDFIHDLYVHMGFHPAWKYVDVKELILDQGELLRVHDRSTDVAHVRAQILAGSKPERQEHLLEWISRTFELDYSRSFGD